ncbi:MAG: ATP-binding protein [Dissulfurispiraceae bacterium]
MKTIRDIRIPFALVLVIINLFVVALLGLSIRDSRTQYEYQTALSSQNLAHVLAEDIKGIIDKVDLALLSVAYEAERQIMTGGIQKDVINTYIVRQLQHLYELDSIRMANASGDILYGPGVVPGINIADRDYFYYVRNDPQSRAVISKPYLSRTTNKWQVTISRRISRPDGTFAGIVYGNFTLEYLSEMFSRINVGTHGSISLWDTDRDLIVRYPEPKLAETEPRTKIKSAVLQEGLPISKEKATITTHSGVDNVVRSFSFRKISTYPLYIIVGIAPQDYLAEWHREVARKVILGVVFFLFSTFFVYLYYRYLSESKRAAAEHRDHNAYNRSLIEASLDAFVTINFEKKISDVNTATEQVTGYLRKELIGTDFSDYFTEPEKAREGYQLAFKEGGVRDYPLEVRHRDGHITAVLYNATVYRDDSGNIRGVLATARDITERHLLEEERLKSQKLESIGRLAGGIAHDFNNLLQGLFGYISMAKITFDQKEKSLAMLEEAEKALHLSVNLTSQLLTFSKGGKPMKKLIRIRPVVENAVKFALSGSNTNYEMNTVADLWAVEADEGQLAQVIQNIVLNADEAMAESGTVRVSLANVDIAKNTIAGLPEGGQFVSIAIQDSGVGISEQNLTRIFDPYFTTKRKGSGLGLATSYSIIKNHGGVIDVQSELNRGTTFTIYLSASNDREAEMAATTPNNRVTNKSRILLMDDEKLVRDVGQEMLAALGHNVVCTEDGRKAIELVRQAGEAGTPFDLVILDLTVKGGMGGEEAIRKIRDINPDVKAIVSSGYSDSPIVANYRAYGFSSVLKKPFRIDTLKDCLDILLVP